MQLLLLALSIILLTITAGYTLGKNKQSMVMKVEEQKPKPRVITFSDEKFSVWYSRFDMIVN
jgi:hypothetical protein